MEDKAAALALTERDEKAAFTPGPWRISKYRSEDGCWATISGQGWDGFAQVVVRMTGEEIDIPLGVANARLIAAAPRLLEALRIALAQLETLGGKFRSTPDDSHDKTHAAVLTVLDTVIAEATGQVRAAAEPTHD